MCLRQQISESLESLVCVLADHTPLDWLSVDEHKCDLVDEDWIADRKLPTLDLALQVSVLVENDLVLAFVDSVQLRVVLTSCDRCFFCLALH